MEQSKSDLPVIIPARGGSVRIPRKNLRPFCGMPLIYWTIRAAQQAVRRDRVFLSTDDDEIAEVAESYGANVVRRDWTSPVEEPGNVPVLHAMQNIDPEKRYDRFVSMLSTVPCRRPGDIDMMIRLSYAEKRFCIISGYNPRETTVCVKLVDGSAVEVIFDKTYRYYTWTGGDAVMSRQDYEKTTAHVLVEERMEPQIYGILPIEKWQCQDVDTDEEWEAGEYWFKKKVLDVYGKNPYRRER